MEPSISFQPWTLTLLWCRIGQADTTFLGSTLQLHLNNYLHMMDESYQMPNNLSLSAKGFLTIKAAHVLAHVSLIRSLNCDLHDHAGY